MSEMSALAFWRPEAGNQGVSKALTLREEPFRASSSLWGPKCSLARAPRSLPLTFHGLLCVSCFLVSYKDTCH